MGLQIINGSHVAFNEDLDKTSIDMAVEAFKVATKEGTGLTIENSDGVIIFCCGPKFLESCYMQIYPD